MIWNRVWLTVLILIALGWLASRYLGNLLEGVYAVKTSWSGDKLVISSIRGHLLVTHLTGFTKRGNPVAARLPEPIFMLDSEGAVIEKAAYDRLEWRSEGRTKDEPPPYGSKVHALFIRLELSEMRE